MACIGGCIGGPGSLQHGPKDIKAVDNYGLLALEKKVEDATRVFDINNISLERNYEKAFESK